jgi:hypothetical protein
MIAPIGVITKHKPTRHEKTNSFTYIYLYVLLFILSSRAQIGNENRSVTDLVLSELNRERIVQRENLDLRIKEIDSKIISLDESLKNTSSATEKVEKLAGTGANS